MGILLVWNIGNVEFSFSSPLLYTALNQSVKIWCSSRLTLENILQWKNFCGFNSRICLNASPNKYCERLHLRFSCIFLLVYQRGVGYDMLNVIMWNEENRWVVFGFSLTACLCYFNSNIYILISEVRTHYCIYNSWWVMFDVFDGPYSRHLMDHTGGPICNSCAKDLSPRIFSNEEDWQCLASVLCPGLWLW